MPSGYSNKTGLPYKTCFKKGIYLGNGKNTQFKKGCVSLNKGKTATEETRKKQSIAHIGKQVWATGKHLSQETKQKISNFNKGKMPSNLNIEKKGKFGNVVRGYFDINGKNMFFRSKWEANYALYLDFLITQNEIEKWEFEPETFIFHKIQFGTRSYKPDFKVFNHNGTIEYHEVKGWMTPQSKTKLKRMRIYYPEIKIVLIDQYFYNDLCKKVGKIIGFY
jgi:hypothetical protein